MRSERNADPAAARQRVVRRETVVAFGETLIDRFPDRAVLGGAPFNVACHLAALGADPVLLTRAGKDSAGRRIERAMQARGLDTRGLQRDPVRATGEVLVALDGDGPSFDILPDQAYDHIHPGLARMIGLSTHPEIVYCGTLAQRGDSRRALRELLHAVQARVFLDVNLRDPWVDIDALRDSLTRADVVKLNLAELQRVTELFGLDGAAPEARASRLLLGFSLHRVIVTCGAAGAWTLDAAGQLDAIPGGSVPRWIDSVGAGDGFAAVCILGMLRNWPVADSLARADAFARALCGMRGAVPDDAAFYRPFVEAWASRPGSQSETKQNGAEWKA